MACDKNCQECGYRISLKKNKNCFLELKAKINKEYTEVEIATLLGVSKEEIEELERSAIKKLKNIDSIRQLIDKKEIES